MRGQQKVLSTVSSLCCCQKANNMASTISSEDWRPCHPMPVLEQEQKVEDMQQPGTDATPYDGMAYIIPRYIHQT